MLTKTHLCKHNYGCYENVILGFYKIFIKTFAIKFVLNNIRLILNPKKLLANILNLKSFKDNIRFALFIGLLTGIYKAALCILRRIFNDDRIATPISGFLAGAAAFVENKKRR